MAQGGNEPDILGNGGTEQDETLFQRLRALIAILLREKKTKFNRTLPLADYFLDRWERARSMGFGEGSSVYDSCVVLGEVKVGKNTWIGPFTILDGSGGVLCIGDNCSISAGVHIYTHDTVERTLYGNAIAVKPVTIGSNVYIGPHSVVSKGVSIGDFAVIGANSLVNRDIPAGKKAFGNPARIAGPSRIKG